MRPYGFVRRLILVPPGLLLLSVVGGGMLVGFVVARVAIRLADRWF